MDTLSHWYFSKFFITSLNIMPRILFPFMIVTRSTDVEIQHFAQNY